MKLRLYRYIIASNNKVTAFFPSSSPYSSTSNVFSQFSSVAQSCRTLWDLMDCSTSDFPVHHQLLEVTQTHVHQVSDAIQPSHPLFPPSPPAFNLSQHQSLFKRVSSSHQVAKVLQFQLQHQSFRWIFRTVFLFFLFNFVFFPIYFYSWRLITLQYCSGFFIHWHESAMDLHVFPIPIPPPTSLSTWFLWVFPVPRSKHLSHASNLGWWSVSP